MSWFNLKKLFGLSVAFLCGCATVRPLVAPLRPRASILTSRALRVGILEFGRTTPESGQQFRVGGTVSAASRLYSALAEKNARAEKPTPFGARFALFDYGNLRAGIPLTEINAAKPPFELDVLLTGTLISSSDRQIDACYDVRLLNAATSNVIRTFPRYCPDLKGATNADTTAEAILSLEQGPQATVTSVQGRVVIIDKGGKGILPGTIARLVAGGDTLLSIHKKKVHATDAAMRIRASAPTRKEMRERVIQFTEAEQEHTLERPVISLPGHGEKIAEEVVGEIYIAAVEENHSVGVLFRGEYALRGDLVFFK